MRRGAAVVPYLTIPEGRLTPGPWSRRIPQFGALPPVLPDWDCATDLSIERTIDLPIADIWQVCALAADAKLGVAAAWISEATSLRGQSNVEVIDFGNDRRVTVSMTCPGRELGQAIKLRTVVFASPGVMAAEVSLAPLIPGAILWEDTQRFVLEGDGSLFPSEVIDFGLLSGVDVRAPWYLQWDPGALEVTVSAGLRLYLNSRCPEFVRSVTNPTPNDLDRERQRVIRWDVARRMIVEGLAIAEFVASPASAWEEGTVGQAITVLLSTFFPSASSQSMAALRNMGGGVLEAEILAAFMAYTQEGVE